MLTTLFKILQIYKYLVIRNRLGMAFHFTSGKDWGSSENNIVTLL